MAVSENVVASTTSVTPKLHTYVMQGSSHTKALNAYHLILAPSYACNIRCTHCYLPHYNKSGLSKETVLKIIDDWSTIVQDERGAMGGIFHLKGGEPLFLPYLNDVFNRLTQHRTLRFMMTTNGTLGSPEVYTQFRYLNEALAGNVQIIVSLDGSNESINAQLRGKGNFSKTIAFIQELRNAGITVYLNNVIHKGNLNDVAAFTQLAKDLDVQQINFLSFVTKGQGEEMASDWVSPLQAHTAVDTVWQNGDQQTRDLLAGSLSDIFHNESCGTCTSRECVGGYRGLLYITYNGTAYSCPNLNYSGLEAGNVHTDSLNTIHDALLSKVYPKVATATDNNTDRYRCKGSNYLSPTPLDTNTELLASKNGKLNNTNDGMSYCFSRNF